MNALLKVQPLTPPSRCVLLILLGMFVSPASSAGDDPSNIVQAQAADLVSQFCIDCHSQADPAGQREFESLDWSADDPETQRRLQEMIDQVTLGAMPPEDGEQPSDQQRLAALRHCF